jgi:hypothetical protein
MGKSYRETLEIVLNYVRQRVISYSEEITIWTRAEHLHKIATEFGEEVTILDSLTLRGIGGFNAVKLLDGDPEEDLAFLVLTLGRSRSYTAAFSWEGGGKLLAGLVEGERGLDWHVSRANAITHVRTRARSFLLGPHSSKKEGAHSASMSATAFAAFMRKRRGEAVPAGFEPDQAEEDLRRLLAENAAGLLDEIGTELGMLRYAGELDSDYRARLLTQAIAAKSVGPYVRQYAGKLRLPDDRELEPVPGAPGMFKTVMKSPPPMPPPFATPYASVVHALSLINVDPMADPLTEEERAAFTAFGEAVKLANIRARSESGGDSDHSTASDDHADREPESGALPPPALDGTPRLPKL